jgi:phosphatidylinositol-bisphosphatase
VRVGTFNVNGENPDLSIRLWVQGDPQGSTGPLDDPDIFLFAFQELDLSTGALLYSTSTLLEGTWTEAILLSLGPKAALYVKVSQFNRARGTN